MRRLSLMLASMLLAATAQAHDSWLVRDAGGLRMSTGNRYPVAETSVPVARECDGAALSCWAHIASHEIEIEPAKVQVYFAEIQASDAVRRTWAQWHADGLPWRERYSKFARIEFMEAASASREQRLRARKPVGAGLEIVVLGAEPVATGAPLALQVLRDGQPLAGFPVELVSERSPLGVWRRTDAAGRLQHSLPFSGRWLLRGTDLRTADKPGWWTGRFVTLAIEAP